MMIVMLCYSDTNSYLLRPSYKCTTSLFVYSKNAPLCLALTIMANLYPLILKVFHPEALYHLLHLIRCASFHAFKLVHCRNKTNKPSVYIPTNIWLRIEDKHSRKRMTSESATPDDQVFWRPLSNR